MKKVFLIASVAVLLSGCSEYKVFQTQVRRMEAQVGVITTPIVLEIDDVSLSRVTDSTVFYIKSRKEAFNSDFLRNSQIIAAENCCSKNKCDVLVNEKISIHSGEKWNQIIVVVSGFPAHYKAVRLATDDDNWMLPFLNRGGVRNTSLRVFEKVEDNILE